MADRVSEQEFFDNKDVITQIQWLKDHLAGTKVVDVQLTQDTEIGSETYGRVTMKFIYDDGTSYERCFDNAAINTITAVQSGEVVNITFHLNNGQSYTIPVTIHVTATASWAGLTGTPGDSTSFTTYMTTNYLTKNQTDASITTEKNRAVGIENGLRTDVDAEVLRATGAETALGTRIDGVITALVGILYPVGSLYFSTNNTNPGTFITGTTWELYSKGRCIIGQNPDDADYATIGATGGAKARTLAVGNLPAHAHDIVAVGNHNHNGGTDEQGWGKTGTMAFLGGESTEGKLGSHKTGTWDYGGIGSTRDMGYVQSENHSHSFTTSSSGGHSHGCGNTGSGNPIDIRDPYVVVAIWKRTA